MKKNLHLTIILIVLILSQYFCPWWTLIIPCIAAGYFVSVKPFKAFMLGFLMPFLVWLFAYLYINFQNSTSPIAAQISQLLHIPNKYLLYFAGSFLIGLVGGFSSLLGFHINGYRNSESN